MHLHVVACDHEEADISMILFLANSVRESLPKVFLCTADTDVVILAVEAAAKLDVRIADTSLFTITGYADQLASTVRVLRHSGPSFASMEVHLTAVWWIGVTCP